MKSSTTHGFRTGGVAAGQHSDGLAMLKREARAYLAATPIAILVTAILDGLRDSGRLR